MKILHRLMFKQFIGPFVGAFVIVTLVLLMQILWKYVDDLVGKGLDLLIIAEMLLYACGQLAIYAFPLAVLLASIITLGSMGENYELIALKAAGVSLQRIVFPLIIMTFLITIGAFLCANYVIPVAHLKWRSLMHDIQQTRPELQIQEGIYYNGIDGYSIRIGRRDTKTKMLYELRIHDHTKRQGNVNIILADSGEMRMTIDKRFLEVTLYSGHGYDDIIDEDTRGGRRAGTQNRTYQFRQNFFDKQILRLELPEYGLERSDEQLFASGFKMMNLGQLNYVIDSMSLIINSHEELLRGTVQPTYRPPEHDMPVDTSLRARVPDDFRAHFDQQSKVQRLAALQEAANQARSQKDRVSGLFYELNSYNRQTWRFKIAWHEKFTMPFACFVFFFIGAPLGSIIRKGGLGTPIVIAVIFYVFYYVINMIGERSAREGALSPFEGMWMAACIIIAVGIFMTWMATRDSTIFNQDMYINKLKKWLSVIFVTHHRLRPQIKYQALESDLSATSMIEKLEELSHLIRAYHEGDFRNNLRLSKIWYTNDDEALAEIGQKYDLLRAILKQSDEEIIRETVAEYPVAMLHNYKIKKVSKKHVIATVILFPVWIYLYIRVKIQKNSLKNELDNIISSNKNLINELHSVL